MWKPNVNLLSRRVGRPGNEIISRIVRFDKESDSLTKLEVPSVPGNSPSQSTMDRAAMDDVPDYDSCVSPSCLVERSKGDAVGRLSLFLDKFRPQLASSEAPTMGESPDDFDSCLSPISTPKWTVHKLEDFKSSGVAPSFSELHSLLAEGCITHFSARPRNGGKQLEVTPKIPPRTVIISGSFNPLHFGHESLAQRAVAEAPNSSGEYYFEISTVNVDKGTISAEEMERRVDYIIGRGHSCLITNAILFDAKSELFPNCIFAIGFDTYVRVVNPKYSPRVTGGIEATMARVEANGCEFFVGGRISEGVFRSLASSPKAGNNLLMLTDDSQGVDFEIVEEPAPHKFRGPTKCVIPAEDDAIAMCNEQPMSPIFSGIPGFRHDISSTEIRLGIKRELV